MKPIDPAPPRTEVTLPQVGCCFFSLPRDVGSGDFFVAGYVSVSIIPIPSVIVVVVVVAVVVVVVVVVIVVVV
jgi:hypothetical protein